MSGLSRFQGQVLALSAVVSAADAADRIAVGSGNEPPEHLLNGVFSLEQDRMEALFEPQEAFQADLDKAADLLRGEQRSPHPARYTVMLLKLATSLQKSKPITTKLRHLLEQTPATDRDAHRAAEIYSETLSHLRPTIIVHGTRDRLHQPSVADAIRASLLAGVRYAWAWQQLGGRQWHLILRRGRILQAITQLRSPV